MSAADALDGAAFESNTVTVELSEKDVSTLKNVLDTIFSSVRSGKVDAVKEITGVESMIDAAHLVQVRRALGE